MKRAKVSLAYTFGEEDTVVMVPLNAESTQGAVDLIGQHESAVVERASLAYPALGSLRLARLTVIGKSGLYA